MKEEVATVIYNLSDLIMQTARSVESESRHPGASADDSDDAIKDGKERIKALREIRERFENEMSK